jgi:hypothetical protein
LRQQEYSVFKELWSARLTGWHELFRIAHLNPLEETYRKPAKTQDWQAPAGGGPFDFSQLSGSFCVIDIFPIWFRLDSIRNARFLRRGSNSERVRIGVLLFTTR